VVIRLERQARIKWKYSKTMPYRVKSEEDAQGAGLISLNKRRIKDLAGSSPLLEE